MHQSIFGAILFLAITEQAHSSVYVCHTHYPEGAWKITRIKNCIGSWHRMGYTKAVLMQVALFVLPIQG